MLVTFSVRTQEDFKRRFFFAHQKLNKPTQKVAYLWQLGGLFSLQPGLLKTAEIFRFVNSFIQPSLLGSLTTTIVVQCIHVKKEILVTH